MGKGQTQERLDRGADVLVSSSQDGGGEGDSRVYANGVSFLL